MVTDGRKERGERTREAILARAAELASEEGLDGLTIGRLATDLRISKSGLFAHFGSKEDLQLAVIRAAREVFMAHVVTPALVRPRGTERLTALCENSLTYSENRVFPGGCFFFGAAAEFDARPGRVRDALAAAIGEWLDLLERSAEHMLRPACDDPAERATRAAQLAFELYALIAGANAASVLRDDPMAYERARVAIRARLA